MIELSPNYSLSIVRPVTNIGPETVQDLRDTFPQPDTPGEEKTMGNVLRPLHVPQAEIIVATEFRRLLRHVGLHAVTQGHIEELAEHLEGVFSAADPEIETPTLPLRTRQVGSRGGKILTVANAAILSERLLARKSVMQYYEAENVRGKLWQHNESTTSVLVARSFEGRDNWLINHLENKLNENPELLPQATKFGAVDVKPVLPKTPAHQMSGSHRRDGGRRGRNG